MIQIIYLRRKCIGCNACVEMAPDHWIMSKSDGKAYLRKGIKKGQYLVKKVSFLEFEKNQKAAESCPVKIITVKVL